jgi:hypothetical protein
MLQFLFNHSRFFKGNLAMLRLNQALRSVGAHECFELSRIDRIVRIGAAKSGWGIAEQDEAKKDCCFHRVSKRALFRYQNETILLIRAFGTEMQRPAHLYWPYFHRHAPHSCQAIRYCSFFGTLFAEIGVANRILTSILTRLWQIAKKGSFMKIALIFGLLLSAATAGSAAMACPGLTPDTYTEIIYGCTGTGPKDLKPDDSQPVGVNQAIPLPLGGECRIEPSNGESFRKSGYDLILVNDKGEILKHVGVLQGEPSCYQTDGPEDARGWSVIQLDI